MKDIRELIRRLHDNGVTIFMSSHLLKEVEDICNIVILLDRGKIVASDSMENIRKRTNESVIKARFLTPLLREDIDAIHSIELIERFEAAEDIGTIHFDGEPSTSVQILSRLISLGLSVVTFEIVNNHLEDFYLAVMGEKKRVK
jgi:ABC-2 type transport system ATP-binding protein